MADRRHRPGDGGGPLLLHAALRAGGSAPVRIDRRHGGDAAHGPPGSARRGAGHPARAGPVGGVRVVPGLLRARARRARLDAAPVLPAAAAHLSRGVRRRGAGQKTGPSSEALGPQADSAW